MNVLLVSQCSKRALKETRRILDQFAERRGTRSWQTAITMQGLQTLHRLLRKSARRNSAVACYWTRGRNHSELMWVVGDASQFNEQGATPTNTTQRDVLRKQDEDDWCTGEDIRLLGMLAGLFHDLGKANLAFQNKLSAHKPVADVYRHEWISLRMFQAFVANAKTDQEWLEQLAELSDPVATELFDSLQSHSKEAATPLKDLPPLAQAIGWLIVSHHRLPMNPDRKQGTRKNSLNQIPGNIPASWCGERGQRDNEDFEKLKAQCWQFPKGTPFGSHHWRQHAAKLARTLLQRPALFTQSWLDNPYVMHLARMGLMLADHYYSSEPSRARYGDQDFALHANTDKQGQLKQRLDEHLIGVEVNAARLLRQLPRLHRQVSRIARHRGFRQRSKDRHFAWQDKAYDLSVSIRERTRRQGFFGINMASTGTGKTLANGRILYALANPRQGARFNIALGLRTLTLQTGDAYRERLHLGPEDMAVLVGGGGIRELHEQQHRQKQEASSGQRGSESAEDFMDASSFVHYESSLENGPLKKWLKNNSQAQKLLDAPILVCTIDHLMPAVESTRGGHQIAPLLRLLTSDLVLDEPDDFAMEDLPALTRLVHWTGMLGGRIVLSSATLPPALLKGLFLAYCAGREVYQKNRGEPGLATNICCAWFDEFSAAAHDCSDTATFDLHHAAFVNKRLKKLALQPLRRKAIIQPVGIAEKTEPDQLYPTWAKLLCECAESLHLEHNSQDPITGKHLSCGLIRMAHINDIIPVAREWFKLGARTSKRIHLCVYHSRHPLLMRSRLEEKLDRLLNRKNDSNFFEQPEVRAMLDQHPERDHLFIVLASPVAEVGRDHDYDWAIVEPSSMRSIIQLAGRIRRHRQDEIESANILLLQTNLAHLKRGSSKPAYYRPGFEAVSAVDTAPVLLNSHYLDALITEAQLQRIDAGSRIREQENLQPKANLADLEHARLRTLMLGERVGNIPSTTPVTHWYNTHANLSGELQRVQPFRSDPLGSKRYFFNLDEDGQIIFQRFEKYGSPSDHSHRLGLPGIETGEGISMFGLTDYPLALEDLADKMNMDTLKCAMRFGIIDLPEPGGKQLEWFYHPALGFGRENG